MNGTLSDTTRAATPGLGLKGILSIPLYSNACYLIADTVVLSLLGVAFWVVVAKLYTPAEVGLASATIAAVVLLARLSGLGFGYGLIRFLPTAGLKSNTLINSCYTIAGLTSLAAAVVFITGLNLWSPALNYIRQPLFSISFVLVTVMYTLFLLTDQTFIGRRCARYVLFKNATAGLLKLAAAVAFALWLSTFGIFASWGLAISVALAIALFQFLPQAQPGYVPLPTVSKKTVNDMIHFSLGNHIAELLWLAPLLLFPLMVINVLGAKTNAYFYITWIIAQTLFTIPQAISYSLFAEGSHEEGLLRAHTIKSVKLCLLTLLPLIMVLLVLSDKLLLFFGRSYSESGAILLGILALSAIPVTINFISLSVMRVKKNARGVVLASASVACLALGSGYILMTRVGLPGVGLGWIAAQTVVAIAVVLLLYRSHHHSASTS